MMVILASVAFVGFIISLVTFVIKLFRRKQNKKQWGIAIICFLIVFVIAGAFLPDRELQKSSKRVDKVEKKTVEKAKQVKNKTTKKKKKKAKPVVKKKKEGSGRCRVC